MIESFEVSDLLLKLVDRSLVTFDSATGRLRLMETVRQYAAELESHSDETSLLRDRHLEYYKQFCLENGRKVRGSDQAEWLLRFDGDFDNLRNAIEWGLQSEDGWIAVLELIESCAAHWLVRAKFAEAGQWLANLKQHDSGGNDRSQALLLRLQSFLEFHQAGPAHETAKRSWEFARKVNDRRLLAQTQGTYIFYSFSAGNLDPVDLTEETVQLLEEFEDTSTISFIRINLGNAFFMNGDKKRAREEYSKCLKVREEGGDRRGVGAVKGALGYIDEEEGQISKAIDAYRVMMQRFMETDAAWDIAGGLPAFALTLISEGRSEEAAQLLGCADAMLKDIKGHRDAADNKVYQFRREKLLESLGEERFYDNHTTGSKTDYRKLIAQFFPDGL